MKKWMIDFIKKNSLNIKIILIFLFTFVFFEILMLWGILPNKNIVLSAMNEYYLSYGVLMVFLFFAIESLLFMGLYFPASIMFLFMILTYFDKYFPDVVLFSFSAWFGTFSAMFLNHYLGKKNGGLPQEKTVVEKVFFTHPTALAYKVFMLGSMGYKMQSIVVPMFLYGFFAQIWINIIFLLKDFDYVNLIMLFFWTGAFCFFWEMEKKYPNLWK